MVRSHEKPEKARFRVVSRAISFFLCDLTLATAENILGLSAYLNLCVRSEGLYRRLGALKLK